MTSTGGNPRLEKIPQLRVTCRLRAQVSSVVTFCTSKTSLWKSGGSGKDRHDNWYLYQWKRPSRQLVPLSLEKTIMTTGTFITGKDHHNNWYLYHWKRSSRQLVPLSLDGGGGGGGWTTRRYHDNWYLYHWIGETTRRYHNWYLYHWTGGGGGGQRGGITTTGTFITGKDHHDNWYLYHWKRPSRQLVPLSLDGG